jgi:GGDEF domain-containing protein
VQTPETIIWAALLGSILTLAVLATVNALRHGGLAAWRGLGFVLVVGSGVVLMTGLPDLLLGLDSAVLLPAKVSLGPLGGALALSYLGIWLGIVLEDKLIRRTVAGGSLFLVIAGSALAGWALADPRSQSTELLAVSALVSFLSVIFGVIVAVRGAVLGDPLARIMAVGCICMAGMVAGLYAKGLQVSDFGNLAWFITACCALAYFLIIIELVGQRARAQRRLRRLAQGATAADAVTGLPTGAELLAQVDHALWRSARVGREAAVIAVWVHNLYELTGVTGQHIDQEIRTSLTAKLRRAVGFRNVVGLHHPRCFIVVVSAVQDANAVRGAADRLRRQLMRPMLVGTLSVDDHMFTPQVGIGIVRVPAATTEPSIAMDEAEALAQAARSIQGSVAIRRLGQKHVTPMARYHFDISDRDTPSVAPSTVVPSTAGSVA